MSTNTHLKHWKEAIQFFPYPLKNSLSQVGNLKIVTTKEFTPARMEQFSLDQHGNSEATIYSYWEKGQFQIRAEILPCEDCLYTRSYGGRYIPSRQAWKISLDE